MWAGCNTKGPAANNPLPEAKLHLPNGSQSPRIFYQLGTNGPGTFPTGTVTVLHSLPAEI